MTRLWSPCNLVKTLRQPCHNLVVYSQSLCNLAATLFNPSQGCDNLVTTLRQPCHDLVVFSQSHCNLAATLSNPSQGCDNLITTLRQPCHDLVVFSPSHCNLADTLSNPSQGCHKVVTSLSSQACQACHNLVVYRICSIRRRSRLVAAYNSIGELNKIVAALE